MTSLFRRTERGFAAIEIVLRRLRVVAGLALALASAVEHQRSAPASTWAGAAALAVLLLGVTAASWRAERTQTDRVRLVVGAELTSDFVAASAVALWGGGIGSAAGALFAVPVLHGALRFHKTGAFGMWAAATFASLCLVIWRWDPALDHAQLTDLLLPLGVLLATGLAIGHVSAHLADEIERQHGYADRAARQADLLGVVTAVAAELHTAPAASLASVAVRATARLGYAYAALVDRTRPTAPVAATGVFADPTSPVEAVVDVPGTSLVLYASGGEDVPDRAEALELVVGLLAAAATRAREHAEVLRDAGLRPVPSEAPTLPLRRRLLEPADAGFVPVVQPADGGGRPPVLDEAVEPAAPAAPPRPTRLRGFGRSSAPGALPADGSDTVSVEEPAEASAPEHDPAS